MFKSTAILVCLYIFICVINATAIRLHAKGESNAKNELKAGQLITKDRAAEIRLGGQLANSSGTNHPSLGVPNGDHLIEFGGPACNGNSLYFPCNGGCYAFNNTNSITLLGVQPRTVALFEGYGCTGRQNVYPINTNTCYYNIPHAVSATCY